MNIEELDLFKKMTRLLASEMDIYYLPEELQRRADLGDLLHQANLVILDYEGFPDPFVERVIRRVFGVNNSFTH